MVKNLVQTIIHIVFSKSHKIYLPTKSPKKLLSEHSTKFLGILLLDFPDFRHPLANVIFLSTCLPKLFVLFFKQNTKFFIGI